MGQGDRGEHDVVVGGVAHRHPLELLEGGGHCRLIAVRTPGGDVLLELRLDQGVDLHDRLDAVRVDERGLCRLGEGVDADHRLLA